jgi:hypothetical protein
VTTVVEHEPDVDRRIGEDLRRVFVPILDVRTRRRLWNEVLDWVIDECLRREAAERTAEGTSTAD